MQQVHLGRKEGRGGRKERREEGKGLFNFGKQRINM